MSPSLQVRYITAERRQEREVADQLNSAAWEVLNPTAVSPLDSDDRRISMEDEAAVVPRPYELFFFSLDVDSCSRQICPLCPKDCGVGSVRVPRVSWALGLGVRAAFWYSPLFPTPHNICGRVASFDQPRDA